MAKATQTGMRGSGLALAIHITNSAPGDFQVAWRRSGYTDHNPSRRDGREAEGGGLLNRYRVEKLYRGFESLSLRHKFLLIPGKFLK
jgi:hypothetical protein